MLSKILIFLIEFYRHYLSPMKPPCCRFYPTCSEYTSTAIRLHGPFKGMWLGLKRLVKCHPYHSGGYDPVPLPAKFLEGHD